MSTGWSGAQPNGSSCLVVTDTGRPGIDEACAQLVREGRAVTFAAVADRCGVARSALFRDRELQAVVNEWRVAHPVSWRRPRRAPAGPLDVLARQWVNGRRARGEIASRSAEVEYERVCTLTRLHAGRPVDQLDRRALLDWMASIGHLAASSRRLYVSAVSRFCRWLVLEEHLSTDPSVALPKVREPRSVPRALPAADLARVMEACATPRERAIVLLMVGCGLRCVEVAGLDVERYDPDKRSLLVRGKGGHERRVPVPPATASALEEYSLDAGGESGPLIRAEGSRSGRRLTAGAVSDIVGKVMAAAGVHRRGGDGRTAHALRHTFATDCLAASGNDILAVQELMGHTSIATTHRYLARAGDERLRRAVEGRPYAGAHSKRANPSEPDMCNFPCSRCGTTRTPVAALRIWASDQGPTGWWWASSCPVCGTEVDGYIDADAAANYLRRGAVMSPVK